MEQHSLDPLSTVIIGVLAVASVGVWFALANRLQRGPILAYEPRRPVPWHVVWILLTLLFVGASLSTGLSGDLGTHHAKSSEDAVFKENAQGAALEFSFVIAFLAVVVSVSQASAQDIGLPRGGRELLRDVRIGTVTWLAALAPVYGMQVLLVSVWDQPEGNPLIRIVEEHASPRLFVLAFVTAVVVAPICEELLFRLLLQGWLEKWEDARLGWRTPPAPPEPTATSSPETEAVAPTQPPQFGVAGLPYGWLPILVSSVLFALAHVGYGPDPIALFILAMMLGYVYQRTHRIVPSIVTHALFNATSLFLLWRVMSAGAQ